MFSTNRLDWDIQQKSLWIATYKDGRTLVAPTKEKLITKINAFDKMVWCKRQMKDVSEQVIVTPGDNHTYYRFHISPDHITAGEEVEFCIKDERGYRSFYQGKVYKAIRPCKKKLLKINAKPIRKFYEEGVDTGKRWNHSYRPGGPYVCCETDPNHRYYKMYMRDLANSVEWFRGFDDGLEQQQVFKKLSKR